LKRLGGSPACPRNSQKPHREPSQTPDSEKDLLLAESRLSGKYDVLLLVCDFWEFLLRVPANRVFA